MRRLISGHPADQPLSPAWNQPYPHSPPAAAGSAGASLSEGSRGDGGARWKQGGYSFDLPQPSSEAADQTGRQTQQLDTKVSGEAWRPGLPAEPRGEGAGWGRGGAWRLC